MRHGNDLMNLFHPFIPCPFTHKFPHVDKFKDDNDNPVAYSINHSMLLGIEGGEGEGGVTGY